MKTFIQRITVVVAGLAFVLFGLAGTVDAQQTYSPSLPEVGPISNTSGVLSAEPRATVGFTEDAARFQTVSAAPNAAGATGTGGGDSALAFTGLETGVLTAAGLGLVMVGGAAIVASRSR